MIMTKTDCKKAMALDPQLAAKLCHKVSEISRLTKTIEIVKRFSHECADYVWNERQQVQFETLQVLGALAGEYKKAYGTNLYAEYVDYRNYEKMIGTERVSTIIKMNEILMVADECCRETWADYIDAENDAYTVQ